MNLTNPLETKSRRLRASLRQLAAGLALAGFASLAAAAPFEQSSDGVFKDRIDWGLMMDMSGPVAATQVMWVNGVQDYMRRVNDAGGINGRKINLLVEDDRYDASLFRVNYEKLVSQTPVLGISGVGNSSPLTALMPTIRRGKVPVVGSYTATRAAIEPVTPMFYSGFCGFKEMAQVGVGFFNEMLKLKAPKVATIHLDVASGKEYHGYIDAEVARLGGTAKSMPIKVTAIDANAQVQEVIAMKPDFIAIHGTATTSILVMRTLQQFGVKIPAFAISYLGTPHIYNSLGADAGSNYYSVSCFTPGSVEGGGVGVKEMSAAADKYGHSELKDDVNYVSGWVAGQLVSESIARAGAEPTREKLVAALDKGFDVDTKGVSAPMKYTKDDHRGLVVLRPYSYDYQAKKVKAYGNYADYLKFVK